MSAFVVSKRDVLYLVTAAMNRELTYGGAFHWRGQDSLSRELGNFDYKKAAQVATMLWQENCRSVADCYVDNPDMSVRPEYHAVSERDVLDYFDNHLPPFNPIQLVKSCDYYDYQSCEHDEWETSEAKSFTDHLRKWAIVLLPEWKAAVWGSPTRQPALAG
jgi:hypothetical protein